MMEVNEVNEVNEVDEVNRLNDLYICLSTIKLYLGICLGFSVMASAESPSMPFTIFKTRWPKGKFFT